MEEDEEMGTVIPILAMSGRGRRFGAPGWLLGKACRHRESALVARHRFKGAAPIGGLPGKGLYEFNGCTVGAWGLHGWPYGSGATSRAQTYRLPSAVTRRRS